LAGDKLDPGVQARAEGAALRILQESMGTSASSPEIANRILREIRSMSGIEDPYALFKRKEMERAKAVFRHAREYVGEDLRSRVCVAALGNSLDFFEDPDVVLGDIPKRLEQGLPFFHDHMAQLDDLLSRKPELVLFLTDNAGEIYFDMPLYEYVRERCGRALLVVKGGPALNDLTRHELDDQLLARFDEVVDTGTDGAGIDWSRSSREFRVLVNSADLILTKGMANFETVYPQNMLSAAFFVFKVKCRPVQEYVGAPLGSFVALGKGAENPVTEPSHDGMR